MLDKLNQLTDGHGALRPGRGPIGGIIALSLGILCFLGVLAFHFPEYLSTPQLRKSCDVIVMPNFHHWHHSQDQEALDRNYSAHFAFIDYLFGTAVKSPRLWPERYGVFGDCVPNGFVKQLKFPFVWKG